MTEEIIYENHTLTVGPYGAGWRVFVYRPGAKFAETAIPNGPDRSECITEAKMLVDRLLGPVGIHREFITAAARWSMAAKL